MINYGYLTSRSLRRGDLAPGASIVFADDRPERLYANRERHVNLLANSANERSEELGLIVNYYAIYTDFIVNDVLAGLELSGMSLHNRQQLRSALLYRTQYGCASLVNADGVLLAPSPRGLFPIIEGGRRIGTAIIHPFSSKSVIGGLGDQASIPDMAYVVAHINGQPSQAYYAPLSGVTLGQNWQQGGTVGAVAAYGEEISSYVHMEPTVNKLDDLLRNACDAVDRQVHPHLQVPSGSIDYDQNGNPNLRIFKKGNIFPVQRDDKDVKNITLEIDAVLFERTLSAHQQALSVVCGVPSTAFSDKPNLPRAESGDAVNAIERPSVDKVAVWRSEIIEAARSVGLNIEEKQNDTGANQSMDANDGATSE